MDVFLTGGTGFLGSEVARLLVARGDRVRALVRARATAGPLEDLGVDVIDGDLSDEAALMAACYGSDAVVHAAALDEVGVPVERREALVDTNVCGTERMLGAALAAGVKRAVHVSTVAVFGDTGGRVADETWVRDPALPWSSVYEETKAIAHGRAQDIGARGLATVTVQPGLVYGPGDPSAFGDLLARVVGGRLPVLPFPGLGVTPVHRDDVAAGVLLALDDGTPGESYVLAGAPVRTQELVQELASIAGCAAPRLTVPTTLLRALAPVGGLVGSVLGLPPNLRELVSSSDGVTFWASAAKAEKELGWTSRPLRSGLAELVASLR